jgi:hypothetical protein
MIEKQEFYHGAAIIKLLEDVRCHDIKKHEHGFVVNGDVFIFLKYRTKSRSPWNFNLDSVDLQNIRSCISDFKQIIVVFICGGDGVCPILWQDIERILLGNPGWVSVRRSFNQQYGVEGSGCGLKGKISLREWPQIAFSG